MAKTIVLIPAYKEEQTIAKVIVGCERYCNSVIVCDDGSPDHTAKIARRIGAEVISNNENQGKGAALKLLFKRAIEMNADIVITIDADGQHNPDDIPKLLAEIRNSDMVIGSRKNIPSVRAVGNAVLRGFNQEYDTESGFRAYRGYRLKELIPSETGMAADREIFVKAKEAQMSIGQVEIQADYQVTNPSKKNVTLHFSDVLLNSYKQATLKHPLGFYGIPGLLVLFIGAAFAYQDLPYLETSGFGSVILLIVGLFLISMAVLIWTQNTQIRKAGEKS